MRTYQKKLLPDGTPNPRFKADARSGDRHKKARNERPSYSGSDELSKFERALFIAHDGEGITTCGKEYCAVDIRSEDHVTSYDGDDASQVIHMITSPEFSEYACVQSIHLPANHA